MAGKHKNGVMNSKTFTFMMLSSSSIAYPIFLLLQKMSSYLGCPWNGDGKKSISNPWKPVVSKYPFRWNQNCVETYGFKHFSQTSNFKKKKLVPMDWILRCLDVVKRFDSFFYVLLFSARFWVKNVFRWRRSPRRETLPVAFRNVKNSPALPSPDAAQNVLQSYTLNSKRKYPIHCNTCSQTHARK